MRAAEGTSGLQPRGRGEAAPSPAPDASVTEQGQLHPRVAESALPRGRRKGEPGDTRGFEGLRASPRCWRSEVGGRRGKKREPLAPRPCSAPACPGGPADRRPPVPEPPNPQGRTYSAASFCVRGPGWAGESRRQCTEGGGDNETRVWT